MSKNVIRVTPSETLANMSLINLSVYLKRTYYKLARYSIPLSSDPQLYECKETHSLFYSIGDNLEEALTFLNGIRDTYKVEGTKTKDIELDFVYDNIHEGTAMEVTYFKRETEKEASHRIKAIDKYKEKLEAKEKEMEKKKAEREKKEYLRLKRKFEENQK